MVVEKILTLSIAAYNVASTLRQALDSLLVPEIIDKLEVFVIDDGGTDESLKIAREYEGKYPDTFHAIHKENGGYGSTVNYSIAHATGKYFKLLDGDDWYDSDCLANLVKRLEKNSVDMVITPYIRCGERTGHKEEIDICENQKEGQCIFEQVMFSRLEYGMHCYAYRTELLQSMGLKLTEHCFYTDCEYAMLPLPHVDIAYIGKQPLYFYRVEVAGQSVSLSAKQRYYRDEARVFWRLASEYYEMISSNTASLIIYEEVLSLELEEHIRTLCLLDGDHDHFSELKMFCKRAKKEMPQIVWSAMRRSKFVFALYMSRYALYPICNKYSIWKYKRSRGGD